MSVFTIISEQELKNLLNDYEVAPFKSFSGVSGGVTNTIYKVVTEDHTYILTIFEELRAEQLPFFNKLTNFLTDHNLPCASVISDKSGETIKTIQNKPAVLQEFLPGEVVDKATVKQCAEVGKNLAKLHKAAQNFTEHHQDTRGANWREQTLQQLLPVLPQEDADLLQQEFIFVQQHPLDDLPSGIIHADLFCDNVLFEGDTLTALLDFYYACNGCFLYDLAITVNDWCVTEDFQHDPQRLDAMLSAYQDIRPLTEAEQQAWPAAVRLAILRFWLSRLRDFHFPAKGGLVQVKDPNAMKSLLLAFR